MTTDRSTSDSLPRYSIPVFYITKRILVSMCVSQIAIGPGKLAKLTQWMAARELRFLRVLRLQHIANAVEQLHVALLRVLLESRDESPMTWRQLPGKRWSRPRCSRLG